MRKHIEWDDPAYIINLTRNLIGNQSLESLRGQNFLRGKMGQIDGGALHSYLASMLSQKFAEMNSETLGRICAYGTVDGIHDFPPSEPTGFINRTGFNHVLGWDYDKHEGYKPSGRQILEHTALATIICIARDILMQEDWQGTGIRKGLCQPRVWFGRKKAASK